MSYTFMSTAGQSFWPQASGCSFLFAFLPNKLMLSGDAVGPQAFWLSLRVCGDAVANSKAPTKEADQIKHFAFFYCHAIFEADWSPGAPILLFIVIAKPNVGNRAAVGKMQPRMMLRAILLAENRGKHLVRHHNNHRTDSNRSYVIGGLALTASAIVLSFFGPPAGPALCKFKRIVKELG